MGDDNGEEQWRGPWLGAEALGHIYTMERTRAGDPVLEREENGVLPRLTVYFGGQGTWL